jgi:hypothetical protein
LLPIAQSTAFSGNISRLYSLIRSLHLLKDAGRDRVAEVISATIQLAANIRWT